MIAALLFLRGVSSRIHRSFGISQNPPLEFYFIFYFIFEPLTVSCILNLPRHTITVRQLF